jgi:hypothetical protein
MFSDCFDMLISEIILKNKKNILMYFQVKNTLKNNRYHTPKHIFHRIIISLVTKN